MSDEALARLPLEDQLETIVKNYGFTMKYSGALPPSFHRIAWRALPQSTRDYIRKHDIDFLLGRQAMQSTSSASSSGTASAAAQAQYIA